MVSKMFYSTQPVNVRLWRPKGKHSYPKIAERASEEGPGTLKSREKTRFYNALHRWKDIMGCWLYGCKKKHMFWYRYYIHYNYNSSTQITEFHSSAPLKYCAATKGACPKPIITIAFLNIKRILFTLPEEDFHFAFSHLWQILYFYQPLAMIADR